MSENKNNILFRAKATSLKLTSMGANPKEVRNGFCEIAQVGSNTFIWNMYDSGSLEKAVRNFKFSANEVILASKRNLGFTVVVRKSQDKYQLIGSLEKESDVNELCNIFTKIKDQLYSNKPSYKTKENSMKFLNRSIHASPLTETKHTNFLTKKNNSFTSLTTQTPKRKPLGEKTDIPTPIFPPAGKILETSPLRKSPVIEQVINDENDVTITAFGARKPNNFYSGNEKIKLKCRYTYLKKHKPNSSFSTFQERKEIWKAEKNQNTVVGFSNLGNTCYMNSILQCLLNIPNFFQDLNNEIYLELVEHKSLYNSLCNLGILKYSNETLENQRYALKRVKNAISTAAARFSGYAQHDAHEFLCQCLHQLNDDLITPLKKQCQENQSANNADILDKIKQQHACPVQENFESLVHHSVVCERCFEVVENKEVCNDFSLVIPEKDENSYGYDLSINDLIDFYFEEEKIEYTCPKCSFESALLTHQFEVLPRVLIFQIKRYDMLSAKLTDRIQLPKVIDMSDHLVKDLFKTPKHFIYDKAKFQIKSWKSAVSESKRKLSFNNENAAPMEKCLKLDNLCSPSNGNIENNSNFTKLKSAVPEAPKLSSKEKFDTDLTQFDDDFDFDIDDNDFKENSISKLPTTVSEDEEDELQRALQQSLLEYDGSSCKSSPSENENRSARKPKMRPKVCPKILEKSHKSLNGEIAENNSDSNYHLVGIVNHHGVSSGNGHYTSDCFNFKNKKWYSFNDLSVKEVTEHEIMYGRCESAYLCFYMHANCYKHIMDMCCQI